MSLKEIAENRIKKLFKLAEKTPDYANRYIEIALKIQQKSRVKLTEKQKLKFCKKCKAFLKKGVVRKKGNIAYLHCPFCNTNFQRKIS